MVPRSIGAVLTGSVFSAWRRLALLLPVAVLAGCGAGTTPSTPPSQPTVQVSMSASPTTISSGGKSTLTVSATNASAVAIAGSDGTTYAVSASGGSQTVSPAATTTYTATATGTSGSASAVAVVTVSNGTPTVTLTASPTSVTAGGSSILTAVATSATTVVIAGSDGSHYALSATGGTQTVTPSATTTYTATATGAGGSATATATVAVGQAAPTVTLTASPTSITAGSSSMLTASASNATGVTISGTDGSSYTLSATGGTKSVSPSSTTTYTATATGAGGSATATATLTVTPVGNLQAVKHVVFMLQENHSFDNYFGMLNPYRSANGMTTGDDGKKYAVDGIDDKLSLPVTTNQNDEGTSISLFKLKSSCVQDLTSSWLESFGDASRYDFSLNRSILMDGFVHTAENFAKNCKANSSGVCAGDFNDLTGKPAMGYYDQGLLNYYYYMASQFAVSDRWFSPLASKSIPNRIATFTGGTTQGLAFDPGTDDHLAQLAIPTIFSELSSANVTWKIYYTVTQGACLSADDCAGKSASAQYPATDFSYLSESYNYLYGNPSGAPCVAPTQASSVVGDTTNSFCIDPTHIAPIDTYYQDLASGSLPQFAFIEAGYGVNDEHPGSGQSVLSGQTEVAKVVNALMGSQSWSSSIFFLSYDEGGGPFDHVPPVPGHSNDYTDSSVGDAAKSSIPDIGGISVQPDQYYPCVPGDTTHCDLYSSGDPGAHSTDAAAIQGFGAQIGFRLPNIVISPFTRKHYVSHVPMDHTAILKFVENRFIGSSAHLTSRDAAQPNLLDFFDFGAIPWATPPTPPTPVTPQSLGYDPCTPNSLGP